MNDTITIDELIYAYKIGFFPMAESKDGDIYWHSPDPRAVFPFKALKIPRSVKQSIRKYDYSFTVNKDFSDVILACSDREDTWISDVVIDLYCELHKLGYAHSVETRCDGKLVGGLYGVAIGGAFFGESMFTTLNDASKAAFYFLVERLKARNYLLLDSQYLNRHTENLGAVEIPKGLYLGMLAEAIELKRNFD